MVKVGVRWGGIGCELACCGVAWDCGVCGVSNLKCWAPWWRWGLVLVRVGAGEDALTKLVLEGEIMLELGVIMVSGGVGSGLVAGGDT